MPSCSAATGSKGLAGPASIADGGGTVESASDEAGASCDGGRSNTMSGWRLAKSPCSASTGSNVATGVGATGCTCTGGACTAIGSGTTGNGGAWPVSPWASGIPSGVAAGTGAASPSLASCPASGAGASGTGQ